MSITPIITITASGGSGQYLYSFDNQPFGGSNIYEVENGGEILIKVIDNSTCYESINTITAWQYPKFFTPNNDGFNDTWSIKTNKKIKVDIFDRFGKLIYQLTNNKSWDGTLEGLPLPSTDYWFGIYYSENKFYKGHFALNR